MRFNNLKQDKGVAGTTVLLGLIVSLFIIGLLVMIFALMGGALQSTSYTSTGVSVVNETGAYVNVTGYTVDNAGALNGVYTATEVYVNVSGIAWLLPTGNYSLSSSGVLTNATVIGNASQWNDANISYSYVYDASNDATEVISDTTNALASSTDFFDLFIVIGSMVVLILLTVIIIIAIRNSGIMDGEGSA